MQHKAVQQPINSELNLSNTLFNTPAQKYIQEFLQHVINNDIESARAMLVSNKQLVLEKGYVTDKAGRLIYGSALQLVLGSDNINPYCNPYFELDMCRMIAAAFDDLPNGAVLRFEQFKEQDLPSTSQLLLDKDLLGYIEYYKTIIATIAKDPCLSGKPDALTLNIIKGIEHRLSTAIRTGLHFDERSFLAALMTYEDPSNFNLFKNTEQRSIYCTHVLGSLQKLFTANFAQLFCFGLKTLVANQKLLTYSLTLGDGSEFFTEDLGVKHYIFSHEWPHRRMDPLPAPWSGSNKMSDHLIKYLHDKQKFREQLFLEWKRASDLVIEAKEFTDSLTIKWI